MKKKRGVVEPRMMIEKEAFKTLYAQGVCKRTMVAFLKYLEG